MKRKLIIASLLAVATPFASASETGDSAAYASCMDAAGGVTLAMLECMASETTLHDQRLNAAYRAAMASLDGDRKDQLRGAQRLWIKYRDAECTLRASLTGGSIDRLNGGSCLLDMTRERANDLQWIANMNG